MGNGNLWLCRFWLELDLIDFGALLPPMLVQVFTDFSTESKSPLDLQVRAPLFLRQECLKIHVIQLCLHWLLLTWEVFIKS